MKNISLIVASLSLVIAGSAFAQNATNGVTTSTDPAKAAAVERHANELKNNPQPVASEMPAKHVMRHHMKKHHMKSHSKRNHPKAMAAK
jgi:hypothetical protein